MKTLQYFNSILESIEKDKTTFELANETTTSTTNMSNLLGKYWLKDVVKFARDRAFLLQSAKEVEVPKGNKDLAVPVEASIKSFTDNTSEATNITWTEIDNLNTVTVTPGTHRFGVIISDELIQQNQIDLITYAKEAMTNSYVTAVEGAIATAYDGMSSPAKILYGGTATGTSSLSSGDIITTDLIAEGISNLKQQRWYNEPNAPFMLYIAPEQEGALLKDSQFTNAAEYGGREVVLNGEIGKYLGVKVLTSPNVKAYTNWGGGSLAGHTCVMVKAKKGVVFGYQSGLRMQIKYERFLQDNTHRIYLNSMYKVEALNEKAVVLIKVADA